MTDRYELTWEPEAIERLAALLEQYPDTTQGVIAAVYRLAGDPRPAGSSQLGGSGTYRRLQLGYIRILYALDDAAHTVRIILASRDDQTR